MNERRDMNIYIYKYSIEIHLSVDIHVILVQRPIEFGIDPFERDMAHITE